MSFNKNSERNSHGINTLVANYLKSSTVNVSQDSRGIDEFMLTRLERVVPALNIINIFGPLRRGKAR